MRRFSYRHGAYFCLLVLAIFAAVIWIRIFSLSPQEILTVAVLDVGQGDSIYIRSPSGVEIVIDGGRGSSLLRELPKQMSFGDRTIDAIIATHPDEDHIGGLVDLVPRYRILHFIEPGIFKDTAVARALQAEVDAAGIARSRGYRGMWLDLGGGVRLDILFPDFDVSELASDKTNEGGIVARLTYASTSMLFMADVSTPVENHLVEIEGEHLASDILKVGHHGSKYSSGESFLSIVAPQFAIISVGQNRYGHPTEEAIERIRAEGAELLRTDEEGTIVFTSDGTNFTRRD